MAPRAALTWAALALAVALPLVEASRSPLLEWRGPIYVAAGFAGIVALALLLVQPPLVAGAFPGVPGRQVHTWIGGALVLAVVAHVAGLWITSPPDVVDVLLFRSPAPFSAWGAVAMWAAFAAALLATVRKRIGLRAWRLGHAAATTAVIVGTVVHAWLARGAMGAASKALVCLLVVGRWHGPCDDAGCGGSSASRETGDSA